MRNILPDVRGSKYSYRKHKLQNLKVIQVLITLLHTALYEDLPQYYLKHDTVTGDVVWESQISQGEQSFNASRDAQALVEILQLSFLDDLIATPFSTFGRLAQHMVCLNLGFLKHESWGGMQEPVCYSICWYLRLEGLEHCDCPHNSDVNKLPIETVCPIHQTLFTGGRRWRNPVGVSRLEIPRRQ